MQPNKPQIVRVLTLFVALISAFMIPRGASAKIPPEQKLETLRTPHFRVHYPATHRRFTAYLVAYLEEAHQRLTRDLDWRVADRIDVVVRSDTDVPNGYASVFPLNRLIIHAVPFQSTSFIGEYDNWIRTLAYHELTHIIANDTSSGFFKAARKVFGSASKINPYQPQWLIEGLAVYYETLRSTYGRGRSSFVDMHFRSAVKENLLDGGHQPRDVRTVYRASESEEKDLLGISIDRLNDGAPLWPGPQTPYLYGYVMNEMLADQSGELGPGKVSKKNSGYLPFFINSVSEEIAGQDYYSLWRRAVDKLKFAAEKDLATLRATPRSEVEVLTNIGRLSQGPVLSRQSSKLYLIRDSYTEGFGISSFDLLTKKTHVISHWKMGGGSRLRLSPGEKQLLYSRYARFEEFKNFSDLFLWDLESDEEIQITKGFRATDPDASPDFKWDSVEEKIASGSVVYVKNLEDANQAIVTFDGKTEKILYRTQRFERLSHPSWGRGPAKDWIVFAIKVNGGTERIQAVNVGTQAIRPLTPFHSPNLRVNEGAPSWQDDGSLLFSSSRGGVYNAYELKWAEISKTFAKPTVFPQPRRVTHVETGVLFPINAEHPDYIYAMVYGARGFDLALLKRGLFPPEPDSLPPLREKLRGESVATPKVPSSRVAVDWPNPTEDYPEGVPENYSAFPAIWPQYWFPDARLVPDGWILGVKTTGLDALERHQYSALLAWDTRANFPTYDLIYRYDGFYPTLQLQLLQENRYLGLLKRSNRGNTGFARFIIPVEDSLVSFGGTLSESRFLEYRDTVGGFEARYTHSTMRSHPNSIDREGGEIGYRSDFALSGYFVGDEKFTSLTARWEQRVPILIDRHFLRFFGSYAGSNNENLGANYYLGGGEGSITSGVPYLVRGYRAGSIFGRKIFTLNNEYWMPLSDLFRGSGTFPIFYERAKLKFFLDTGSAEYVGNSLRKLRQWPVGTGVQLLNDVNFFYRVPITLGIGFNWGFSERLGGEKQITLGLYSRIF